MQQLRNAGAFIAASIGSRERIAMALWLARVALRRSLRPGAEAIETISFRGLKLRLDWASSEHVPLREVLIRGEYWPEPAFRPSAGQTVVDIGANAGIYSVFAARQVGEDGRVIAIEPNPSVVARLAKNVQMNGLDRICTIVPVAVSNRTMEGSLVVGANTTIGTLERLGRSGIEVPVMTLDALAEAVDLPEIDLMKIDVEGSEVEVLEGGPQSIRRSRRIVIEVSDLTSAPIAGLIREAGFDRVFQIDAGRDSGGGLVFGERHSR